MEPNIKDDREIILGQILAAQSIMHALPSKKQLEEFVLETLRSIPGIKSTGLCIKGFLKPLEDLEGNCQNCSNLEHLTDGNKGFSCGFADKEGVWVLPLQTSSQLYGFLQIKELDKQFEDYKLIIHNFTNILTITIENQWQQENLRKTNTKLEKSEVALSNLISNLEGMVYHCKNDKDWTMDFVSSGSLALTGYKPGDIERNHVISYSEIIHPDDREAVWDEVQEALGKKEPFILNYRITTSEGEIKYAFERGRGIWLENGELEGLQGFITDVSELVKKTQDLEKSERKFKSYFEMPLTGVAIFDTEGRWIELNDKMCEIVGYSREELMGFVWTEATHPDDIEPCINSLMRLKAGREINIR